MPKKKEDKIQSILSSIDNSLKQQNSFGRSFFQSLLRGFGTALGATVMLALATSLTVQFVDTLNWNMFSDFFINEAVQE